jgi:hypothetical protein
MKGSAEPNIVSHRQPGSWVLGDSGGFQIGTGALKESKQATGPDHAAALWRRSTYREAVLRWFELNCDYAMTLDMPLWVRLAKYAESPFHKCSVELLTDLTVENLRYFADHRGEDGPCSVLNVLQGLTDEQDDYWYERVRDFDF